MSQQLGLGVHGKPKKEFGAHLNVKDLDKFKEDQIVQLYELLKAATGSDDHLLTHTENKLNEQESDEKHKSWLLKENVKSNKICVYWIIVFSAQKIDLKKREIIKIQ